MVTVEQKARLFSRSLKRTRGKGLGLYLIIMLAKDFHGKISHDNILSKGKR
ncbi:hypothetical protein [Methanocella paludicola]|uniref:hypothetical protein n=1 Tax=Methanocella paludicola TaxID=570267 RepID=UPI0013053BE5|nr:hypothetical protein [Methanocella paludicola]